MVGEGYPDILGVPDFYITIVIDSINPSSSLPIVLTTVVSREDLVMGMEISEAVRKGEGTDHPL